MTPTLIGAISIFVAMVLMRMTYRTASRQRPDGIRWRGIDWSRAEPPEGAAEASEPPAEPPPT